MTLCNIKCYVVMEQQKLQSGQLAILDILGGGGISVMSPKQLPIGDAHEYGTTFNINKSQLPHQVMC